MISQEISSNLRDYGSFNEREELFSRSADFSRRNRNKENDKKSKYNKSDTFLNYTPRNTISFLDSSLHIPRSDESSQAEISQSYIVEPVAFIQNLASSIMSISLGQFIYTRILTRLLNEFNGFSIYSTVYTQTSCKPSNNTPPVMYSSFLNFENNFQISPDEYEKIRSQAQAETANLYFISALFSAIPVLLMTNFLGVNCSVLGRKTLMLIYLFLITIRYALILFQCLNPHWPDWLFYLGAFIEGLGGGSGIYYLSLYCFISDTTSISTRSYRITFINNLNSIASLCVTFVCGYVIKYYGYFLLFLTSLILILISFVYTLFLIPEPLSELKDKNFLQRIKACSFRRLFNCFKVYFNKKPEEQSSALLNPPIKKQTKVLFLIIFANFIYYFGTVGLASIFTLYLMNAPFCFDSIEISNYTVFSTVVSLVMCLFVSKYVPINDLLVCILSAGSFFVSVFFYIFGTSVFDIYLGALISSVANLEFGYVKSIVSKSVEKHEVADALSLILIVDTFMAVFSMILFPILYAKFVSQGIQILFIFANVFVFITILCHM